MDAGRLDKRVKIQAQTTTRNAIGEPVKTWTDVATVWAAIEPFQGREFWAQQQIQSELTHRVRIRFRAGVTAAHRVLYGSRVFAIRSVLSPQERREELQLMCVEGVSNG
jgi:SPP1 family predicted phage head-tail adaptor